MASGDARRAALSYAATIKRPAISAYQWVSRSMSTRTAVSLSAIHMADSVLIDGNEREGVYPGVQYPGFFLVIDKYNHCCNIYSVFK